MTPHDELLAVYGQLGKLCNLLRDEEVVQHLRETFTDGVLGGVVHGSVHELWCTLGDVLHGSNESSEI